MRRDLIALCGLLVGSIIACGHAMAERRVALVIGNAHYANTTALRNSVNDAEDVAAELKQLGFEVTLATDLDESAFAQQIDNFGRRLQGADVGLFYYAGHGLQVNDKNFLVATNAKLESEFLVPSETIEVDAIIHLMESRAGVNLVFLDACRDNPLADNLRRSLISQQRSVSLGRGLARMEPTGRQTLLAFSAAPGQEAEDGNGRNSPFAEALLRHMPEAGVEVSVMLKQVSADVRRATHSAQRPQQISDMAEPFYFTGAAAAAGVNPPSVAPDSSVELAFFQTAVAANDCAAIRAYLTRYPQGVFLELAKLSEQRLCGAPTRPAVSDDQLKSAAQVAPPAAAPLIESPGLATSPPPAGSKNPAGPPLAIAALPRANVPPTPTAAETARSLQSELLRVGCGGPDLTTNSDWDDESRSALAQFNRFAKTSFTGPSQAAITAVHGHESRVCPLVCGKGMKAQRDTCIAEPQHHPRAKKQAERPRLRGRDIEQRTGSRPPRKDSRSHAARAAADNYIPTLKSYQGSTSPIGRGPNGMKCYTLDEAGLPPRIVCH